MSKLEHSLFPPFMGTVVLVLRGMVIRSDPHHERGVETIRHKDFFNEFTLMLLASLGAFYIGEYPEAVAVMLFMPWERCFRIVQWTKPGAISSRCWTCGRRLPPCGATGNGRRWHRKQWVSVRRLKSRPVNACPWTACCWSLKQLSIPPH